MKTYDEKTAELIATNDVRCVSSLLHLTELYNQQIKHLTPEVHIDPMDSFSERAVALLNCRESLLKLVSQFSELRMKRDITLTNILIKDKPKTCHREDCSKRRKWYGKPQNCDCWRRDYSETEASLYEDQEKDIRLTINGGPWIFCYPFVCQCCGVQITVNQFCFCGNCGHCDVGRCGHPYPWDRNNAVSMNVCDIWTGERMSVTTTQMLQVNRMYLGWGLVG